jgi:hypothetical protein
MLSRATRREVAEPLARFHEYGRCPRRRFETANDDVGIERVQFEPAAEAAGGFGGQQCGAGAEEWINNDVAAAGQVEDGVL